MYSKRSFFLCSLAACVISLALANTDVSHNSDGDSIKNSGMCPLNSGISISVFRNTNGEWLTSYSAYNKLRNVTRAVSFDLKKKVVECGDSRFLVLKGFLKDMDTSTKESEDQHLPIFDELMEKLKNETTNETENGSKCSTDGFLSKDDVFSMKKSLEVILQDTKNALDEVKVMGKRLNGIEASVAKDNREISCKADLLPVKETLVDYLQQTKEEFEETFMDLRIHLSENLSRIGESTIKDFNHMKSRMDRFEETLSSLVERLTKEPLQFHPEFTGKNIALSQDFRTAERLRPRDGRYHGGVISQRPLLDGEIFKIRIENTVNEWVEYGSSIGLIPDPKPDIKQWESISGREGVWSIFSWGDSTLGYSTAVHGMGVKESMYPLELRNLAVGTIIGVMRRSNGDVHFFLNGLDKGVAFRNIPTNTHAFVDIRYHLIKISIVD